MTTLHNACKELKDKNEIAIIEKYGYSGKRFTIIVISKIILFLFIYISMFMHFVMKFYLKYIFKISLKR